MGAANLFTGFQSVIYPSSDLSRDRAYWSNVFGIAPYIHQPFYVGFRVGSTELGLDPHAAAQGLHYPVTYWQVRDMPTAAAHILASGATPHTDLRQLGGGIMTGTFKDYSGNIVGIMNVQQGEKSGLRSLIRSFFPV